METYEKLGVFYLGKEYDLKNKKLSSNYILYDSKDLVTHAVCVGMTGSGKTGLCLGLIEEAAMDGIPAILVDPKGDLSDLLLTFPELRPQDFEPWVNPDDANQKGLSVAEFAAQQAEMWKKGLADWDESGERIQRLRQTTDFRIYTPGSNAGLPVSILSSFAVPPQPILDDDELLRDRISSTVTSLLGLVGIEVEPMQSREHILLSNLLESSWRSGRDMDLASLISMVQTPPLQKIGVLDLETFYPSKDRFSLMMALNNLLASPGFKSWLEGEPLEIGKILYSPQGKPRVAIFSIAHLGDSERMFFTSLLLNQILGWMRTQSGTTSLRAIFYMDEIFGYLPPVQNPPSKLPMITLLKQARAFGLGLVLATQNPVDLDYKALSNTGTWFIGRLQTERDKARLLDGLEGAAASTGSNYDRQEMEKILAGLGNRVFLMNNTHEDQPVIMQTRWLMSYMRGPLTRDQIKILMDPFKSGIPKQTILMPDTQSTTSATTSPMPVMTGQMPVIPSDISRYFLPATKPSSGEIVYQPDILGVAKIRFSDDKLSVDNTVNRVFLTSISDLAIPVDWAQAISLSIDPNTMQKNPGINARFSELPASAMQKSNYDKWSRDFATWLSSSQELILFKSASGMVSNPGESAGEFRVRLSQTHREGRDIEVDKLRLKYAPKIAALQEKIRSAESVVNREKSQSTSAGLQTAISVGATLLGALTGRKLFSQTNLTHAGTVARGVSRTMDQSSDVKRAQDNLKAYQEQLTAMNAEFTAAQASLGVGVSPENEVFDTVTVKPKKTDISVQLVTLVWAPFQVGQSRINSIILNPLGIKRWAANPPSFFIFSIDIRIYFLGLSFP